MKLAEATAQSGNGRCSVFLPETAGSKRASLIWTPLLAIASAAFLVETPFFFLGIPSGHDVEFHLYSWLEVLSQWRQGIIYPRWASLAHFGYGEPRFVFYPPASWTLGAALTAVFPWTLVPSIYLWVALAAAGISMFFLARQWFDRRDATFAAVLYAVNPYHLVIVYWRSAFAELLASMLLPLMLLLVLRMSEQPRRCTIWMAMLLGSAWLINAPAALMVHYSLALMVLFMAAKRRSPRLLIYAGVAVLLGAALAGFYLVPAIYEQRWVDIAQSISAGSRPLDNFLWVHTTDADHDAFNRLISWVALSEIVVTAGVAFGSRSAGKRNRELWLLLLLWAAASSLLMFSISNAAWIMLPKLRFMQFPWRWLLCMGVPLTLFVTIAVRKWMSRLALYIAMLCVIAFAWKHCQAPWWDNSADLHEMQDNMAANAGYEGTDEYTPAGADPSAVDKDARRVTVAGQARAAIHVFKWNAESKLFTAELSAPDELVLKLFAYPAWSVEVNAKPVQAGTLERTGQMLIPVETGLNRVEIKFIRTWDRRLGGWTSVIALLLSGLLLRQWAAKNG